MLQIELSKAEWSPSEIHFSHLFNSWSVINGYNTWTLNDASTLQCFNISAFYHFDVLMLPYFNVSMLHCFFDASTAQHFKGPAVNCENFYSFWLQYCNALTQTIQHQSLKTQSIFNLHVKCYSGQLFMVQYLWSFDQSLTV